MRYKCVVKYDGTRYSGFQVQSDKPTVQFEIEQALFGIHDQRVRITAAGRTDAGVHARGQVFHFDSSLSIEPDKWLIIFSKRLPRDIQVLSVETVDDRFHARYDAVKKEYRYFVSTSGYDVFRRNQVAFIQGPLDTDRMKEAARHLVGEHDFRSFVKRPKRENTVRTIERLDLLVEGTEVTFVFVGNGFLHNMVRIIVALLLEVGVGKHTPSDVKSILDEKNRVYAPVTAPPEGLYLWRVDYE